MWNCIKGCLNFLIFLIIVLILFILFDWLGARDAIEAAINWQGDALVTLSNWGDDLQDVMGLTQEKAGQAAELGERTLNAVQQAAESVRD